jgi:hypothetical protein
MEKYICIYQFERGLNTRKCQTCYHAYPHDHTEDCDGVHCPQSNPHYYDQELINNLTTCKLIEDKKKGFEPSIFNGVPRIKIRDV